MIPCKTTPAAKNSTDPRESCPACNKLLSTSQGSIMIIGKRKSHINKIILDQVINILPGSQKYTMKLIQLELKKKY